MADAPDVDPRTEADAQICRAFDTVCNTRPENQPPGDVPRPYTAEEFETLFFSLGMAIVQLKKLPGGKEAHDLGVSRMRAELGRRGRTDILDKLDAEAAVRHKEIP